MTLPCNNEAKVRTFRRLFTSLDNSFLSARACNEEEDEWSCE